jgi:hypothetical protein
MLGSCILKLFLGSPAGNYSKIDKFCTWSVDSSANKTDVQYYWNIVESVVKHHPYHKHTW